MPPDTDKPALLIRMSMPPKASAPSAQSAPAFEFDQGIVW